LKLQKAVLLKKPFPCTLMLVESQRTGMQVTFLGTNGWYDSATGNTVSALISTENYDIILDAGKRHCQG